MLPWVLLAIGLGAGFYLWRKSKAEPDDAWADEDFGIDEGIAFAPSAASASGTAFLASGAATSPMPQVEIPTAQPAVGPSEEPLAPEVVASVQVTPVVLSEASVPGAALDASVAETEPLKMKTMRAAAVLLTQAHLRKEGTTGFSKYKFRTRRLKRGLLVQVTRKSDGKQRIYAVSRDGTVKRQEG